MYWSLPNFMAVVFKKQYISHQLVTRTQDLASTFSKIFIIVGEEDTLPHPTPTRHLAGRGAQAPWCWDPNLGPLNFSAVVAPLTKVTTGTVDRCRPVGMNGSPC